MADRMAGIVVVDQGNYEQKIATAAREWSIRHALVPLDGRTYNDLMARAGRKGHPDVAVINGQPYAFGSMAEQLGFQGRRVGSDRYTADYYGAFFALALFNVFPKGNQNVILYASHAPKDLMYRGAIRNAAEQEWTVESSGETRTYDVKASYFFDEPMGGLMNLVLDTTGRKHRYKSLLSGRVLVIDVGGFTTDFAVMEDGQMNYTAMRSIVGGTLDIEEKFVNLLRTHYAEEFQSVQTFRGDRVRKALETDVMNMGGLGKKDVKAEVSAAKVDLVRAIADRYRRMGGVTQNDFVVLTGGGAALLEGELMDALGHEQMFLACGDGEEMDMRFANVRGGLKVMRMLSYKGQL